MGLLDRLRGDNEHAKRASVHKWLDALEPPDFESPPPLWSEAACAADFYALALEAPPTHFGMYKPPSPPPAMRQYDKITFTQWQDPIMTTFTAPALSLQSYPPESGLAYQTGPDYSRVLLPYQEPDSESEDEDGDGTSGQAVEGGEGIGSSVPGTAPTSPTVQTAVPAPFTIPPPPGALPHGAVLPPPPPLAGPPPPREDRDHSPKAHRSSKSKDSRKKEKVQKVFRISVPKRAPVEPRKDEKLKPEKGPHHSATPAKSAMKKSKPVHEPNKELSIASKQDASTGDRQPTQAPLPPPPIVLEASSLPPPPPSAIPNMLAQESTPTALGPEADPPEDISPIHQPLAVESIPPPPQLPGDLPPPPRTMLADLPPPPPAVVAVDVSGQLSMEDDVRTIETIEAPEEHVNDAGDALTAIPPPPAPLPPLDDGIQAPPMEVSEPLEKMEIEETMEPVFHEDHPEAIPPPPPAAANDFAAVTEVPIPPPPIMVAAVDHESSPAFVAAVEPPLDDGPVEAEPKDPVAAHAGDSVTTIEAIPPSANMIPPSPLDSIPPPPLEAIPPPPGPLMPHPQDDVPSPPPSPAGALPSAPDDVPVAFVDFVPMVPVEVVTPTSTDVQIIDVGSPRAFPGVANVPVVTIPPPPPPISSPAENTGSGSPSALPQATDDEDEGSPGDSPQKSVAFDASVQDPKGGRLTKKDKRSAKTKIAEKAKEDAAKKKKEEERKKKEEERLKKEKDKQKAKEKDLGFKERVTKDKNGRIVILKERVEIKEGKKDESIVTHAKENPVKASGVQSRRIVSTSQKDRSLQKDAKKDMPPKTESKRKLSKTLSLHDLKGKAKKELEKPPKANRGPHQPPVLKNDKPPPPGILKHPVPREDESSGEPGGASMDDRLEPVPPPPPPTMVEPSNAQSMPPPAEFEPSIVVPPSPFPPPPIIPVPPSGVEQTQCLEGTGDHPIEPVISPRPQHVTDTPMPHDVLAEGGGIEQQAIAVVEVSTVTLATVVDTIPAPPPVLEEVVPPPLNVEVIPPPPPAMILATEDLPQAELVSPPTEDEGVEQIDSAVNMGHVPESLPPPPELPAQPIGIEALPPQEGLAPPPPPVEVYVEVPLTNPPSLPEPTRAEVKEAESRSGDGLDDNVESRHLIHPVEPSKDAGEPEIIAIEDAQPRAAALVHTHLLDEPTLQVQPDELVQSGADKPIDKEKGAHEVEALTQLPPPEGNPEPIVPRHDRFETSFSPQDMPPSEGIAAAEGTPAETLDILLKDHSVLAPLENTPPVPSSHEERTAEVLSMSGGADTAPPLLPAPTLFPPVPSPTLESNGPATHISPGIELHGIEASQETEIADPKSTSSAVQEPNHEAKAADTVQEAEDLNPIALPVAELLNEEPSSEPAIIAQSKVNPTAEQITNPLPVPTNEREIKVEVIVEPEPNLEVTPPREVFRERPKTPKEQAYSNAAESTPSSPDTARSERRRRRRSHRFDPLALDKDERRDSMISGLLELFGVGSSVKERDFERERYDQRYGYNREGSKNQRRPPGGGEDERRRSAGPMEPRKESRRPRRDTIDGAEARRIILQHDDESIRRYREERDKTEKQPRTEPDPLNDADDEERRRRRKERAKREAARRAAEDNAPESPVKENWHNNRQLSPPPKMLKDTGRSRTVNDDGKKTTEPLKPGLLRSLTLSDTLNPKGAFFGALFARNDLPSSPRIDRRYNERDIWWTTGEEETQRKRKAERKRRSELQEARTKWPNVSTGELSPLSPEWVALNLPTVERQAKSTTESKPIVAPPSSQGSQRPKSHRGKSERSRRHSYTERPRSSKAESDRRRDDNASAREGERGYRPRYEERKPPPPASGIGGLMKALVS